MAACPHSSFIAVTQCLKYFLLEAMKCPNKELIPANHPSTVQESLSATWMFAHYAGDQTVWFKLHPSDPLPAPPSAESCLSSVWSGHWSWQIMRLVQQLLSGRKRWALLLESRWWCWSYLCWQLWFSCAPPLTWTRTLTLCLAARGEVISVILWSFSVTNPGKI